MRRLLLLPPHRLSTALPEDGRAAPRPSSGASSLTPARRWVMAGEAGQGTVEAAVAFPLLLVVAVALVQFALYAHAQHVVVAAVQEGARVASGEDRTLEEGRAYAEALLRAGLGRHADTVFLAAAESDGGGSVVVEASGSYRIVVLPATGAGLPLHGRAIIRKERFRAGRAFP